MNFFYSENTFSDLTTDHMHMRKAEELCGSRDVANEFDHSLSAAILCIHMAYITMKRFLTWLIQFLQMNSFDEPTNTASFKLPCEIGTKRSRDSTESNKVTNRYIYRFRSRTI